MISRSAPASAASAATSSMPGVSTTGSNSLGTVLVAGRKRVPSPAAGTIAVRGIGTRDRVIVHTLSPSSYHIACAAVDVIVDAWCPRQGRSATAILAARRTVTSQSAQRGGRSAVQASARRRSRRRGPCARTSRSAPNPGQSPCWTPCYGSTPWCCCRSLAAPPTAPRSRCCGASTGPAGWSRRGSGCASHHCPGCPPRRWPKPPSCWCPRWRSTVPVSGWGAAQGSTTVRLPLADPAARLVAVVRDDELVDRLPAEPHDVRMTHALTPQRGLVALG